MTNTVDYSRLLTRLGYSFSNLKWLKQALTHRSVTGVNYEKFEFLGDAILSFVMADTLLTRFPELSEGELSKLRAYLVKGEMLAQIALELNLGDYLILGPGELRSGGFRRESILADSLEAIFAAVYKDGGLEKVKAVILTLYEQRLSSPDICQKIKDSKTQLQEFLQAHKLPLPQYELVEVGGTVHDQIFHVVCRLSHSGQSAKGQGATRRKAEQEAASVLFKALSVVS